MNDKLKESIQYEIKGYANFMSIEKAIAKVKRNRLGRHDGYVDDVVKALKKAV